MGGALTVELEVLRVERGHGGLVFGVVLQTRSEASAFRRVSCAMEKGRGEQDGERSSQEDEDIPERAGETERAKKNKTGGMVRLESTKG